MTWAGVKSCAEEGGAEGQDRYARAAATIALRPPATVRRTPVCVTAEPAPVSVGIVRDWIRDGALSAHRRHVQRQRVMARVAGERERRHRDHDRDGKRDQAGAQAPPGGASRASPAPLEAG